MELKTKQMRRILESLQKQISGLQLLLTNVSTNPSEVLVAKLVFSGQLQSLTQRFKNLTSDDNSECEEININVADTMTTTKHIFLLNDIEELIKQIDDCKLDEHAINYTTESLLNKFALALRALEDVECLSLKQRLQDCLDYVKEMSTANQIEDFQNIKELGTSILELLEPLQKYRRSLVSTTLSEKLALYTSQLCTSFGMLVQLAQAQHCVNAPIYVCKKYICERTCTCCKMILELLDGTNPSMEEEALVGENHFVYRMDLALDIILEIPSKTHQEQLSECVELWLRLEDVFSHAMAITQVCQAYNFKAITGSCQSIVQEYEKLKQQLQSDIPDAALNTLFMNTLTDALYRLERKVNVAVLTLVMEVFSNPYAVLRKLVMTCGSSLNAKGRSKNDLNNLIEDFDQLFDQTVQIGMFAIACCKDMSRNNKIRNCLAGFESLETELISAIISFYLHPDNKEMRSSVKLLTTQWQLEMNKFQSVVNLIINSAAFCQVVLDSLQEYVTTMSDCLDNRQPVTQLQVHAIIRRASALFTQVTAVMNDIGIENIDRQTILMTKELNAAIFEVNTAAETLLVKNATEPQQLRVIKRCELILKVIQRLQPALSMIMNNTTHEKSRRSQGNLSHGTTTTTSTFNNTNFPPTVYGLPRDENSLIYIRTPYTVKAYKLPLSIQPANSTVPDRKPSDLSCLIPYIESGRALRNEHTIMYNTPRRKNAAESIVRSKVSFRNLSSIRQHLFGRDSLAVHSAYIDITEESIDLTAALEKISTLSVSADAMMSPCQFSSKLQNISPGTTKKELASNVVEKSCRSVKSVESLNKSTTTRQSNERAISGSSDVSLVIETCKKLNSIRLSNSKTQKSTSK
ncbi:uncharacterized protein LOC105181449 [Harpegnathos saltator]|uniref:Serendipity locus protein alpha n=1 Tax=Harpegnathos saltator TaxID=610380 RepID=E2BCZ7_HARSA|nr:uncharacterized protein LOC105181449 [Harpegnathos saltator]EFN86422.1 Serendipity locus protein alpha [Harpegnathos saltator]